MEAVGAFFASDIFRIILKLVLSLLLSGLIGLERSVMNKPAGFGTHAILGISACLTVIASSYYANFYDVDVTRIPAQVLAGIGFIGAGAIMKNGFNVKGVTTAAGLFAVTCIGLTVGIGYYSAACIATLLIFLLMSYSHTISDKLGKYETIDLSVLLDKEVDSSKTLKEIDKYIKSKHIELISISNNSEVQSGKLVQYVLTYNNRLIDKSDILATMITLDGISKVDLVDD